jgi:hypothetical protein
MTTIAELGSSLAGEKNRPALPATPPAASPPSCSRRPRNRMLTHRQPQYLRSEDPVEAARFVVSDAATLLWEAVRDRPGLGAFAARAAPQLLRWESRYGWTTRGWGQVPEKETSLASVVARMGAAPDAWTTFADCYPAALDQAARADVTAPPQIYGSWGYGDNGFRQRERARNLAGWHGLLLERLAGSEAEDRLGRLASHRP